MELMAAPSNLTKLLVFPMGRACIWISPQKLDPSQFLVALPILRPARRLQNPSSTNWPYESPPCSSWPYESPPCSSYATAPLTTALLSATVPGQRPPRGAASPRRRPCHTWTAGGGSSDRAFFAWRRSGAV